MSTAAESHPGRVVSTDEVSADIRILRVEVAGGMPFQPGQYVFLESEGQEPRAFSIASAPGAAFLEFHIRNSGHGMSKHAVETVKTGSILKVRGPLGTNVWRESGRPMLLLAGGIGIAPMKSIVDAYLKAETGKPLTLYWGARDKGQLYLDPYFRDLQRKRANFAYVPVLSDKAEPPFRAGYIGPAVAEDFDSLKGFGIYLAGPKGMIDATLPLLLQKGAEKEHIFSDAFSL